MVVLRYWMAVAAAALGVAASPAKELVRRAGVQTDLSGGWCRSNFLASNLAGDTLRFTDLDGGILPRADVVPDSDILYLVEIDISKRTNFADGKSYKLSLWDSKMIKLKDQAFYSNNKNDTFYLFGGRALGGALSDDGIWEYSAKTKKWERQQTGVRPARVGYGAHINVPEVQAGFWIGGARNTDTSPEIRDDTNFYPIGLTIYNTTTREIKNITDTPMGPTQFGGLVHVPAQGSNMGSLIYIGGERPDKPEEVRTKYTFTIASWKTVWVFDIARQVWYEQETSGDIPPARTQFCAVTARDTTLGGTHHVYIVGGATFDSKEMQDDVYALAVPSFKWYKTGTLPESRMSQRCEVRGRSLFMIGGRRKFADGAEEGCFEQAINIWDLNAQKKSLTYDPDGSEYVALTSVHNDIVAHPKPSKWASKDLENLYFPPEPMKDGKGNDIPGTSGSKSSESTSSPPSVSSKKSGIQPGVIAAIVIGGLLIPCIIILIIVLRRRRRAAADDNAAMQYGTNVPQGWGMKYELDHDPRGQTGVVVPEKAGVYPVAFSVAEADTEPRMAEMGRDSVRYEMDASPGTPRVQEPIGTRHPDAR